MGTHGWKATDGKPQMGSHRWIPTDKNPLLTRFYVRFIQYTQMDTHRWKATDKNDDNYGPRRNGVKNSWGLKLLGLLLALMPNFIQISSKSDK